MKPGADASLKKVFAGIGVPPDKAFTPDSFQTRALEAVAHSDCLQGPGLKRIGREGYVRRDTDAGKNLFQARICTGLHGRGAFAGLVRSSF